MITGVGSMQQVASPGPYTRDFSEYAVGDITNHADWSNPLGTLGLTDDIETATAALSGKQLRISESTDAWGNSIRFVPVGSPTDVEVLALMEGITTTGTLSWGYIFARGNPGVSSASVGFSRVAGVPKLSVANGPAFTFTDFTWTGSTSWWLRLRVISNNVKARVWTAGSAEPGTWNADMTGSSLDASGQVGFVATRSSGGAIAVHACRFFSVATGGATAPGPTG